MWLRLFQVFKFNILKLYAQSWSLTLWVQVAIRRFKPGTVPNEKYLLHVVSQVVSYRGAGSSLREQASALLPKLPYVKVDFKLSKSSNMLSEFATLPVEVRLSSSYLCDLFLFLVGLETRYRT